MEGSALCDSVQIATLQAEVVGSHGLEPEARAAHLAGVVVHGPDDDGLVGIDLRPLDVDRHDLPVELYVRSTAPMLLVERKDPVVTGIL